MDDYEWSFFDGFDDTTLIPVNLTAQEMALLRSAIAVLDNVDVWSDSFDFYNDVQPALETLNYIVRQGGA
jgi:hypothetical protein